MGAFSSSAIAKTSPDIGRWVASSQETGFGTYFREQEVPHPSTILRDHSGPGHKLGELYDVMMRTDATLAGLWEKRWKAVLGLPWDIEPGDGSPLAQEIRDNALRMIDGIEDLDTNIRQMMGAQLRGISFNEIRRELVKSGPLAGMWCPVEVVDRPMWRFGFKNIDGVDRLHVRNTSGGLDPVNPDNFITYRTGTKDNPWGGCPALLDQVYWFYYLTLHVWKYASVALEKWAQPTVVGTYKRSLGDDENNADEEAQARLLDAAADIQTEYAIALPEDLKLQLLEATRSGSVSYEAYIALLDRAKALVILGEVDTSGLSKGPGSFAKSRVSNDVRLETIRMDGRGVANNALTRQLIAPWVRMNYGPSAPVPRWVWDIEEAEPRESRQKAVQDVMNRGLEVTKSYYYSVHQVPVPKDGEETVRDPQVVGTVTMPRVQTIREDREEQAALAESWDKQELKRASA